MNRFPARFGVALLVLLLLSMRTRGAEGPPMRSAVAPESSRIGRATVPQAAAHPGKSGVHALPDPAGAFAVRMALAAAADRTLDVQYYIWHGDETGTLLFEALWQAAERGVRVRLLLDDNNTAGLDETIAAMDGHANIEVRLYNPLFHRRFRWANYLTDARRLNRRMHNKSFTADGQVTIVGGRNVGNEYFGTGRGAVFADLDVMATGAVVDEVSEAFGRFWNSRSAHPARDLLRPAGPAGTAALQAQFRKVRADPQSEAYLRAVRDSTTVRDLLERSLSVEWTSARLLCDDPAKTLDTTGRSDILLLTALLQEVGRPATSFDLVSPYLVPGRTGTEALTALAGRGVQVRILTNSLSSTDVSAVHAGYSRRRGDLLRGGVRLFELEPSVIDVKKQGRTALPSGASGSLHAKTFSVDRSRIFVGSFNFDERSALLNTEMGLLIDSPHLATRLSSAFDANFPGEAYEVRLAAGGSGLEWIERTASGDKRYDVEPGTSFLRRAWVRFLELLPIEREL